MELEGDVRMELSSSISDDQGYNVGFLGLRSSMEIDGFDDKLGGDFIVGLFCSSNLFVVRDKRDIRLLFLLISEEGKFLKYY